MNQSIMSSLRAAQEIEREPNKVPKTPILICVCGHREGDHGEEIGGSFKPHVPPGGGRKDSRQIRLHGCCGEPLPAKVKRHNGKKNFRDTEETVPHPKVPSLEILVAYRISTCPCEEFRPVMEITGGRPRCNQWRPVDPPRSGLRDRNPAHHALMRMLKAMATDLRKTHSDETEVAELMEEHVRWLPDGQRCWARGCRRTQDILPVYLEEDLSEMRCPEHRP